MTQKIDLEVVRHTGMGLQVVQHLWKVVWTFGWSMTGGIVGTMSG
jgi:hypothetical protein